MSAVSFASRRRLAALGALAGVVLGAVSFGRGIVESPVAILVALVAFLVAIGSAWVALTRRGRERQRATWVALILFALALIAAVGAHSEGWSIMLGGFAIAACLPLGRYALGRDRESIARMTPPGDPVPAASHPVLLVNPASGQGKAVELDLVGKATARGIECREFGAGADLGDLVRAALAGGADVVGVAGGDGSQALVADLVSQAGVHMVCVPSGTRNHFAMDLGLDRSDPLAALDAFGEARVRKVDLARANGKAFLNNVSMGIYGQVVANANYRENKIETAIETLPTMVEDPPDLRFGTPDGHAHTTVQVVHVSNNPYLLDVRGAGGRPSLDTGELGVVTAELGNPAGVAEMFARAALGALGSAPGFNAWTTHRFEVESDAPIAAGMDGEAVELSAPAVFTIQPAALQIRIPLNAVGHSPAAFVPQTRQAVMELLRRAFLPTDHWRPLPRR